MGTQQHLHTAAELQISRVLAPGIKVDDARQAHETAIANGAEGVPLTNSIQ